MSTLEVIMVGEGAVVGFVALILIIYVLPVAFDLATGATPVEAPTGDYHGDIFIVDKQLIQHDSIFDHSRIYQVVYKRTKFDSDFNNTYNYTMESNTVNNP
jgi:hypothetical protein